MISGGNSATEPGRPPILVPAALSAGTVRKVGIATKSSNSPLLRTTLGLEADDGTLGCRHKTGTKIRLALETAGVEFIDENAAGPGRATMQATEEITAPSCGLRNPINGSGKRSTSGANLMIPR